MKKIISTLVIVFLVVGAFLLINKRKEPGQENRPDSKNSLTPSPYVSGVFKFSGEKGENAKIENEEVRINTSIFNDNKARFYNVSYSDSKTIYFFVVKDKNGIYRAAANACQVCFSVRKGFHQEGNEIVCNNCGNRYPIEKIATEKGGCNPAPINPNLEVKDGQVVIRKADFDQVLEFF